MNFVESKSKGYFLVYVRTSLMNSTKKRIRTEHSNPTSSIESSLKLPFHIFRKIHNAGVMILRGEKFEQTAKNDFLLVQLNCKEVKNKNDTVYAKQDYNTQKCYRNVPR